MSSNLSIWDKVDFTLTSPPAAADQSKDAPDEQERQRKAMRRARRVLDAVSVIFWTYAFLKLFVVDFDQRLVDRFAAGQQWLIDYKFFIFIAWLALLVLATRRLRRLLLALAYVAFFPVIVVCWKAPRALYRTKSWVAAFAAVNAVTSVMMNLRYSLVFSAVVLIAGLGVVIGESTPALSAAAVVLATALLVSLARTIRFSMTPSRFLSAQRRAIQRTIDSDFRKQLTSVSDELRSAAVEKFNSTQQQAFVQNLSQAVLVHRFLYFWAYQLEQYRRSPGSIFFSSLSYVWLLVQAVAALTFVNSALYKIDGGAFAYDSTPSVPVMVRYSLTSLWGNEIDALRPVSDIANVVSILAYVIGGVILATLLLTLFLNYRQTRDDTAIQEAIDQIRDEGQRLDEQLEAEFEVTVTEALTRLEELRSGFLGIIAFFSTRIPQDFERRSHV